MATSLLGVLKKLPEPAKAIRDRDHDLEVLLAGIIRNNDV
jgi:hypothetical protein